MSHSVYDWDVERCGSLLLSPVNAPEQVHRRRKDEERTRTGVGTTGSGKREKGVQGDRERDQTSKTLSVITHYMIMRL